MIRLLTICCFLLSAAINCPAAATISEADRQILRSFWEYAEKQQLSNLSVEKRIPVIARFFLGKPYKSNTLNVTQEELPVINLRELDCVTLVENVLALAYLSQYNKNAVDSFVENIIKIRYRNGEIEDYTSRLHYSTDWLYEMQRQNLLKDVTLAAGGIKYSKPVNFMSNHYTNYPVLAKDKSLLQKIRIIETEISRRTYYYIPKEKINSINGKIQNGDVVLITTKIAGLDTSHLGFALKQGGKTYLLHASSTGKKVVITEQPLQEYMKGIQSQTGIILGRITFPLPDDSVH